MEYNRRYIRIISSAGTPIFIPVATNTQMGISRPDNTTIVIDNGELSVSSTVLGDITTLGETKLDKVPGGLDTTATHVVSAINELHGEINTLQTVKLDKIPGGLQTTATSVVGAINELGGRVADAEETADAAFDLADAAKDIAEAAERAVEGKYVKPETGIPPSDLAAGVQTSLGKADSALQTESDPTVPAWAKAESKPGYTFSEIEDKPHTVEGYGITDVYTKSEVYDKSESDAKYGSAFKFQFSGAFSQLPSLEETNFGYVYNINEPFTTTSDFLEGEGHNYPAGTNVAVGINPITAGKVWDVLSGLYDFSVYYTKTEVDTALADKVDKVADKGLSTEDYTTTEKTKLFNIEEGAQVNVKPDWNASAGAAAEILNKPTIPPEQVNADWNASSGKGQILNKPAIPDAQIQSDWNQSDTGAKDYIKNKPTIPSPYTLPTASDIVLGGVKVGENLTIDNGVLSAPSGGWPLTIKEGF